MNLASLRRRIDKVDRGLLRLFNERAAIVQAVAAYKRKAGLPVYDPKREKQVVRGLQKANAGPLHDAEVAKLFGDLIADFRAFELQALRDQSHIPSPLEGEGEGEGGKPLTVSVVGLGLIGGSIALALRRRTNHRVIGFVAPGQKITAKMRAAAHEVTRDPRRACEADVVILATPVSVIAAILKRWARFAKPGSVWMDVGSVKGPICRAGKALPRGVAFVGGHPMAGSEKTGIENARADLFEGASFALTPVSGGKAGLGVAEAFVRALGSYPLVLTAEEHDCLVARTSHLPHFVSAALAAANSGVLGSAKGRAMTGRGFRDVTRLADGDVGLWADIASQNGRELKNALKVFIDELSALADMSPARTASLLRRARAARRKLGGPTC